MASPSYSPKLAPENEVNGSEDAERRPQIIELQGFFHVEDRKRHEDREGDDLLQNFQLAEGQNRVADSVGRNLEQVFEKSDPPADQRRNEPGFGAQIPQMCIPGKGHEDIAAAEEEDREADFAHGNEISV